MATVDVPWGLRAGSVLPYFANKSKVPVTFLPFLAHAEPLNLPLSPG